MKPEKKTLAGLGWRMGGQGFVPGRKRNSAAQTMQPPVKDTVSSEAPFVFPDPVPMHVGLGDSLHTGHPAILLTAAGYPRTQPGSDAICPETAPDSPGEGLRPTRLPCTPHSRPQPQAPGCYLCFCPTTTDWRLLGPPP